MRPFMLTNVFPTETKPFVHLDESVVGAKCPKNSSPMMLTCSTSDKAHKVPSN